MLRSRSNLLQTRQVVDVCIRADELHVVVAIGKSIKALRSIFVRQGKLCRLAPCLAVGRGVHLQRSLVAALCLSLEAQHFLAFLSSELLRNQFLLDTTIYISRAINCPTSIVPAGRQTCQFLIQRCRVNRVTREVQGEHSSTKGDCYCTSLVANVSLVIRQRYSNICSLASSNRCSSRSHSHVASLGNGNIHGSITLIGQREHLSSRFSLQVATKVEVIIVSNSARVLSNLQ